MISERYAPRRALRAVHYGYVVALLGLLALLGSQGLGRFGYPLILPGMRDGLGLSYSQAGFLASVNSAGYLLFSVGAGAFAARYGSRLVVSAALALASLAMFLLAVTPSFLVALLAQFLVGTAMAFASVPSLALCTAWFAPTRRGMAAGIVVAGSGLGLVVSGAAVPLIYSLHAEGGNWWRFAWAYFGLVVAAITLLCALLLRDRPRPGQPRVGETVPAPAPPLPSRPALLEPAVWRSGVVWHLGLLSGINTFAWVGFATFFGAYLINEQGESPQTAGTLWGLAGFLALFSGLLWGSLSDRFGRKAALALIFVTEMVAFATFALWPALPGYALAAILYGSIARANLAVSAAACGDLVGPRLAPAAFGINGLVAGLGLVLGPMLAGPLADAAGSFRPVFLVSAAAATVGLLVALRLRMPKDSL